MITYTFNYAFLIRDKYKKHNCRIWCWDTRYKDDVPIIEIRYQYLPDSSDGGCQLLYLRKDKFIRAANEYPSGTHPKYIEKDIKALFNSIGLDYKHK